MVYAGLLGSLLGLLGIELGIMWVLWVRIKFVTVELVSEFKVIVRHEGGRCSRW